MLGFLNVYKPSGVSSAFVVNKIKKNFNIKKIGHMGTLDPMASGILPVAVGKATRMFDYFLDKQKSYIATFTFGYETDTLDATGVIISTTENLPTKEQVISELKNQKGKISQMPPQFSAKKVNGRKAYDIARSGQTVELKPKEIEIFEFDCINQSENSFDFYITCSSGTYIRSMCRDLAIALNSKATMTKLERVQSGFFDLKNSTTLEDLLNEKDLSNKMISIEKVFEKQLEKVEIDEKLFNKLINGIKVKNTLNIKENTMLKLNGNIVGISGIKDDNILYIKTNLNEG